MPKKLKVLKACMVLNAVLLILDNFFFFDKWFVMKTFNLNWVYNLPSSFMDVDMSSEVPIWAYSLAHSSLL